MHAGKITEMVTKSFRMANDTHFKEPAPTYIYPRDISVVEEKKRVDSKYGQVRAQRELLSTR